MSETAIVMTVFAVMLVVYLIIMGIGLADYIITSLSLYTMAERRKISNPWLAWIPFGSSWIIGSIADCHDGQNGANRKWRVVLLTLGIVFVAGFVVTYAAMFVGIFAMALQFADVEPTSQQVGGILGFVIPVYLIMFLIIMIGTAYSVCSYICIYKIFEVTAPQKAIKYIIISLIVPLGCAFCLLKCKNSMFGVPTPALEEIPPLEYTEQSIDNTL